MAVTKSVNSYVSPEEAEEYFDARPHADAWTGADDDAREKALLHACRVLDHHVVWRGLPAVSGQALAWPRTGLTPIGVDATSVPVSVRLAQMELSLVVLAGTDPMVTPDTTGVKRQKVGELEVEYRGADTVQAVPDVIFALVAAYGRRTGGLTSIALVR